MLARGGALASEEYGLRGDLVAAQRAVRLVARAGDVAAHRMVALTLGDSAEAGRLRLESGARRGRRRHDGLRDSLILRVPSLDGEGVAHLLRRLRLEARAVTHRFGGRGAGERRPRRRARRDDSRPVRVRVVVSRRRSHDDVHLRRILAPV